MTVSKKSAAGVLLQDWSAPVRTSGVRGDKGDMGDTGPAPVYRGVYSPSVAYYGTSRRVDIVKYDNSYYVAAIRDNADSGFINKTPSDTAYWNIFGASFDSVATNLLLAEKANIAGWIFRNERLESQSGNVYLDGENGTVRLNGTIQLSTGYSGNYSDVNLFYLPGSSQERFISMGFEEDDIGKVCRLYNSNPIGGYNYLVYLSTFGIKPGFTNSDLENTPYALLSPQEVLEVSCLRLPPNTYGDFPIIGKWLITGRFGTDNFKYSDARGRFPRMMAMGRITGTSSGVSIDGDFYDGRSVSSVFSASRQGVGFYRISFSSGVLPYGYKVMLTGYGSDKMKGTSDNYSGTFFDVYISDDASTNDGSCEFIVFAPYWQYDLINF
jgi:hypothetical protein